MNSKRIFLKNDKVGFALCAALLGMLAGCASHADRPLPGSVYVAPPAAETIVVAQDSYVYYPGYDVYYNRNRRQYVYLEGGAWVSRPTPRGVSVNALLASPSVRMDFHDAPAYHHAAMVRQYPKNWTPSGSNQGHKEN